MQPVNEAEEKKGVPCTAYSVPINDVAVVETCNVRYGVSAHRIQITTLSVGYFDFDCISRNGHDILLAFLQASLPVGRILDGGLSANVPGGIRLTSSSASCMDMDLDVDALTAQHLKGHSERETWIEKISRRTGKVVSSLSEMSESFCENMTCCQVDRVSEDDIRESPPRQCDSTGSFNKGQSHLELDDGSQLYSPNLAEEQASDRHFQKKQAKLMLKNCHLPSGLSLEVEPVGPINE